MNTAYIERQPGEQREDARLPEASPAMPEGGPLPTRIGLGIGNTPLSRLRDLERQYGIGGLWVKLENFNPYSNTHKDRPALAHVLEALSFGQTNIAACSCGNYAKALMHLCVQAGLRLHLTIPEESNSDVVGCRDQLVKRQGCDPGQIVIIRSPGSDYRQALEMSNQLAKRNDYYNANAGACNRCPHSGELSTSFTLQSSSYAPVFREVVEGEGKSSRLQRLHAVLCPAGNGTLTAGLEKGAREAKRLGLIEWMPSIFSVTDRSNNLSAAVRTNGAVRTVPSRKYNRVTESLAGDAVDLDQAREAVYRSGGWVFTPTPTQFEMAEKVLEPALERATGHNLVLPPLAAAGLVPLLFNRDEFMRHFKDRADGNLDVPWSKLNVLLVVTAGESLGTLSTPRRHW